MNADFNVGFIHEQSFGEQMFNRASLNEFHGEKVGDLIDRALERFDNSIVGLDSAIANNKKLLEMLGDDPMMPEYEAALRKHIVELNVNELPRVGRDSRKVETLRDILLVLQSEFIALREMTQKTTAATRALQPQIDQGLFVVTVLEGNTPFNQAKVSLGFGRGDVEAFMSYACHATILAVQDSWPLGFQFLLDPKKEPAATVAPPAPTTPPDPIIKVGGCSVGGSNILASWLLITGLVGGLWVKPKIARRAQRSKDRES